MKNICKASLICLALFLSVAAIAKTKQYEVQVGQPVQAGGMQLKAGVYQVEIDGNSLAFYQKKKEVAKVSVHSEELQSKSEGTSITTAEGKLVAIQFGGTKTKLVVEGSQ